MKKYGKFASAGLFVILGIFILLQYQNCGNSSTSSNTSAVGPSGLTYTVTLTVTPTSFAEGSAVPIQVNVVSSGSEQTSAVIGYLQNGTTKAELCQVYSQGPSVNYTNSTCNASHITQKGPVSLYVDILDPNFPINEFMIDCVPQSGGVLPPGCAGNFQVTVQ